MTGDFPKRLVAWLHVDGLTYKSWLWKEPPSGQWKVLYWDPDSVLSGLLPNTGGFYGVSETEESGLTPPETCQIQLLGFGCLKPGAQRTATIRLCDDQEQ